MGSEARPPLPPAPLGPMSLLRTLPRSAGEGRGDPPRGRALRLGLPPPPISVAGRLDGRTARANREGLAGRAGHAGRGRERDWRRRAGGLRAGSPQPAACGRAPGGRELPQRGGAGLRGRPRLLGVREVSRCSYPVFFSSFFGQVLREQSVLRRSVRYRRGKMKIKRLKVIALPGCAAGRSRQIRAVISPVTEKRSAAFPRDEYRRNSPWASPACEQCPARAAALTGAWSREGN